MPTLEEVKEQIGRIDGASKFLGRKEIKELPKILWEDEAVEKLVQGTYASGNGVLVATNKRLIFVDKGIGKLKVEDFPYDKLSSIQYQTGWMTGSITMFASGNKAEISNVMKDQCRGFSDYVRARITAVTDRVANVAPLTPAASATGEDPIEQLRKLGELRDAGVVTPEEFEAKKAELLSRL